MENKNSQLNQYLAALMADLPRPSDPAQAEVFEKFLDRRAESHEAFRAGLIPGREVEAFYAFATALQQRTRIGEYAAALPASYIADVANCTQWARDILSTPAPKAAGREADNGAPGMPPVGAAGSLFGAIAGLFSRKSDMKVAPPHVVAEPRLSGVSNFATPTPADSAAAAEPGLSAADNAVEAPPPASNTIPGLQHLAERLLSRTPLSPEEQKTLLEMENLSEEACQDAGNDDEEKMRALVENLEDMASNDGGDEEAKKLAELAQKLAAHIREAVKMIAQKIAEAATPDVPEEEVVTQGFISRPRP